MPNYRRYLKARSWKRHNSTIYLLCFTLLFTPMAFATGDSQEEEPPLLVRTSRSSIRCCPTTSTGEQLRCLDHLTRGNEAGDARAACAAVIGTSGGPFAILSSLQSGCEFGSNQLGIVTSEYHRRGWWQNGPPPSFQGQMNINPREAPISAPGCNNPFSSSEPLPGWWNGARARCSREGYHPSHVYISTAPSMDIHAEQMAQQDPWQTSAELRSRVILIRAHTPEEIRVAMEALVEGTTSMQRRYQDLPILGPDATSFQNMLQRLPNIISGGAAASGCNLISYSFVWSHGTGGTLGMGPNNGIWHSTVGNFFRTLVSPCMMTPQPQVQFFGCHVACGSWAATLRNDLERVFLNGSASRPTEGTNPFVGARFLFNAEYGLGDRGTQNLPRTGGEISRTESNFTWNRTQDTGTIAPSTQMQVFSPNRLGVEYTVRDSQVTFDVPVSRIPACP